MLKHFGQTFGLDQDALGAIHNPAAEAQFRRQMINERPKPDSLNGAANRDPDSVTFHLETSAAFFLTDV
jgi:hypothetical protein